MMKEKKIVFHCYGGVNIGWGHVMRCLHLAQWLQGKFKIFFVINQNDLIAQFLRDKGFTVFEIANKLSDAKELEKTLNTIFGLEPQLVVNDIHDTTMEYMQAIKSKNIRMINFDDTSSNAKYAQAVIDANRKEKEGKLFGCNYIVLSSLYCKLAKKVRAVRKRVKTIVVSFGGSDPQNLTGKTLKAFEQRLPDTVEVQVIIGPAFTKPDALIKKWSHCANLTFVRDADDISQFLLKADISIVGGGITMYESLCLGTPTIVIAQNKAQAKNARRMERRNAALFLGEGHKISDKKIIRKCQGLIDNYKTREKMSHIAKSVIDGKGVFRILEQIELHV